MSNWLEVILPAGYIGESSPDRPGVVDIARIYAISPMPVDVYGIHGGLSDGCAIWVEGIGMLYLPEKYDDVLKIVTEN